MTRHKNRALLSSPVTLVLSPKLEKVPALLIDISLSGMRLKLEDTTALKEKAIVEWVPVVGMAPISIDISKVWSKKGNEVGFVFENLSPKQKSLIGAFVKYHREGTG